MNPFTFARCGLLVLGALLLSACAKQAEVGPPPSPAPAFAPPAPPTPKPPKNGKGGGNFDPLGGLLGTSAPTGDSARALEQKYQAQLVGTWTAALGDGYTEERTYNPDGTYSAKLTGPTPATASGKYAVLQLVGSKGLKVRFGDGPDARALTINFEGAELEQLSLRTGVTGTFRKK